MGIAYCTELTDHELLVRIAVGDRVAFSAFYDRVAPEVFALTRGRITDIRRAESVFEDVFLEVWCHASRFDPALGTAADWVVKIVDSRTTDGHGTHSAPVLLRSAT